MKDRDLLALAAKAAGVHWSSWDYQRLVESGISIARDMLWNPLTDDGDALRLAVKLDIQIWRRPSGVEGVHKKSVLTNPQTESLIPDPYAATRRAIVRAATEIGKVMP